MNSTKIKYTDDEVSSRSSYIHNFDVSVIMPFFKKLSEFKKIFPKNYPFLLRNGIEVIICMDECSEENDLIDFVKSYPHVNWKIIVNRQKHNWRNPSKAINVGIRNASKKYIFVCSPESEFSTDLIYFMRKALHFYPGHFAVGFVDFRCYENKTSYGPPVPYGSIMVEKRYLTTLKGYDETLLEWGGDDDNMRARLELIGIKKLQLNNSILIHWESEAEFSQRKLKHDSKDRLIEKTKQILYPNCSTVNNDNWGKDFHTIAYDWKCKVNVRELLLSFVDQFVKFKLFFIDLNISFDKILLVQCHNEVQLINKFLEKNSVYFDAIIILDDDSNDGTYEAICHDKVLLKVQKKRTGFNDLENRNLLLQLVSFFNTEWISFLDVDEEIDARFCDFSFTKNSSSNVIGFQLVHLWNNPRFFNSEYPFSNNGIQVHYRMFRNIGYSQILTSKKALHFVLSPYIGEEVHSNILVLHYGHLDHSKREQKAIFYSSEDKYSDQLSYEHLLNRNPCLAAIDSIAEDSFLVKKTV